MSEHYHVLVPGESGHEFPLFSVGCICGDMECPETGRDTPGAEQRAVKEWAESAQAAELAALQDQVGRLTGELKIEQRKVEIVVEANDRKASCRYCHPNPNSNEFQGTAARWRAMGYEFCPRCGSALSLVEGEG